MDKKEIEQVIIVEKPHSNCVKEQDITVTFRSYKPVDRAWVAATNLNYYQTVHKFDASFSNALVKALDHLETKLTDVESTYLIAKTHKGPVGCIFLSPEEGTTGRIRLFYLEDAYRGKGVGAKMLQQTLTQARANGLTRVRVSTFDRHNEACQLYKSFGFVQMTRFASTFFSQVMVQLDYEITL